MTSEIYAYMTKKLKPEIKRSTRYRGMWRYWCVGCKQHFPFGHRGHGKGDCDDPLCYMHHPENWEDSV